MICITIISSIMQNFLYKNKTYKFLLVFRKKNIWKIGTLVRKPRCYAGTYGTRFSKLFHS